MDKIIGMYLTFETVSKKDAGTLLGADNLVGDFYELSFDIQDGNHRVSLINRFDQNIGYFDDDASRKLSVLKAQGINFKTMLSFVAYSDHPDPGKYWGEMAVIAFNPAYEREVTCFCETLALRLGDSIRPDINFGSEAAEKIIESGGTWQPSDTLPQPKLEKGSVYMKNKRTLSEKMIEQGRAKNIGCYIVSWAFIIGVIALILFGLKSCGIF